MSRSARGAAKADDSLADKVLLPGFVEGHSHLLAGGMWRFAYIGFHDRIAPDGKAWPGLTDIGAVIGGLQAAQAGLEGPEAPLVAWGFDPIFLTAKRLDRHDLDRVSTARPIAVIHSNFHIMTVNTAALRLAGTVVLADARTWPARCSGARSRRPAAWLRSDRVASSTPGTWRTWRARTWAKFD